MSQTDPFPLFDLSHEDEDRHGDLLIVPTAEGWGWDAELGWDEERVVDAYPRAAGLPSTPDGAPSVHPGAAGRDR